MKNRTKLILLALGALVALCSWGICSHSQSSAIDCTLSWGRLAPFPHSALSVTISSEGNMFTRAFRASFTAPAVDIERWLLESPGTRSVVPEIPSPSVRYFLIAPGGGAQHAEVTVDDSQHLVFIYVYWS